TRWIRSMWVTCARLLAREDGRLTCTPVAVAVTWSAVSVRRSTWWADTTTFEIFDFVSRVGSIGTGTVAEMCWAPGSAWATVVVMADSNAKWATASGTMASTSTTTTTRISDRIIGG